METHQLRQREDADVDPGAENARDRRPRGVRPALGHQRDAVGPHAADAEADQEPQQQHLLASVVTNAPSPANSE